MVAGGLSTRSATELVSRCRFHWGLHVAPGDDVLLWPKDIRHFLSASADPVQNHKSCGWMTLVYWSDFYAVLHSLNHTVWIMVWPYQFVCCARLGRHIDKHTLIFHKCSWTECVVEQAWASCCCFCCPWVFLMAFPTKVQACENLFVISATQSSVSIFKTNLVVGIKQLQWATLGLFHKLWIKGDSLRKVCQV